jgi:hypothetical protein
MPAFEETFEAPAVLGTPDALGPVPDEVTAATCCASIPAADDVCELLALLGYPVLLAAPEV